MNYKITIKKNPNPKYLFLDIDGVMNSFNDYKMSNEEFMKKLNKISFHLNPEKIKILNEIYLEYKPTIILSSYWRKRFSLKKINKIFKKSGFIGKISDKTTKKGEEHNDRWNQIQKYISQKNVKNYIILDDEHITRNQKVVPNFIKTDSYVGLKIKHLKEIEKIWN